MNKENSNSPENISKFKDLVDQVGYEIVGQRIRRLRGKRNISLRELAESAGVSKNTITRLEKGESAHPSTIKILCKALKITPEQLLSSDFEPESKASAHYLSEGRWFNLLTFNDIYLESEISHKVAQQIIPGMIPFSPMGSRDGEGRFNPNMMKITEPTISRSHRGEEFAFVLSGKLRIIFDDKTFDLGIGDSLFFWGAETHRYEPIGDEPAMVLSIVINPFPIVSNFSFTRED